MALLDRLFVRRRAMPRFSSLPQQVRRRLSVACQELTSAEDQMAQRLGLPNPPRLVLVDEEEAVVLFAADRRKV